MHCREHSAIGTLYFPPKADPSVFHISASLGARIGRCVRLPVGDKDQSLLPKGLGCSLPNRLNWTQLSIDAMTVPVPLLNEFRLPASTVAILVLEV
jgi:hypothetical protein